MYAHCMGLEYTMKPSEFILSPLANIRTSALPIWKGDQALISNTEHLL